MSARVLLLLLLCYTRSLFVGDIDGPNAVLPVIQGTAAFEQWVADGGANRRAIVLVDVKEVLAQKKYWYDFRQVYDPVPTPTWQGTAGFHVPSYGKGQKLKATPELIQQCRESASFVMGPKLGAITGLVYVGALHLGCTLRWDGAGGVKRWPERVWRRVIFDEVQDLVQEGSDAQDCFVQLTRKADHVWLLTATPFPHGNASVSANHQLLGFQRFNAGNVEVEGKLNPNHPFERIKRRLYIRSPASVREKTINAMVPVKRETLSVQLTPIERAFYDSAVAKAAGNAGLNATDSNSTATAASLIRWCTTSLAQAVRMVCIHPAASDDLRAMLAVDTAVRARGAAGGSGGQVKVEVPGMSGWDAVNNLSSMRQIAEKLLSRHRQRAMEVRRQREYLERTVGAIRNGLALARHLNMWGDNVQSGWELPVDRETLLQLTADPNPPVSRRFGVMQAEPLIRRMPPADGHTAFATWDDKEKDELLTGYDDVAEWAKFELLDIDKRREYIRSHERLLDNRLAKVRELDRTLAVIAMDVTRFTATVDDMKEAAQRERQEQAAAAATGGHPMLSRDLDADLKLQHGSKPVALLRYLQRVLAPNNNNNSGAGDSSAGGAAGGSMSGSAPAPVPPRRKVIVFSMWHGVLKMVQKTLHRAGVRSVWCEGTPAQKQNSLAVFNDPSSELGCDVLLMSAQSAAAGANLQLASHVVLLDPAGTSAVHGATLERQAVGRAVRMGQTKTVTVVRVVVADTVESELYSDIDEAARQLEVKEGDSILGAVPVEGAHNPLPAPAEPEVRAVQERTWEEIEAEKRLEAERTGQMVDLASDAGVAAAAAAANVKIERGATRVKLEGEPSSSSSRGDKKKKRGENVPPPNLDPAADEGVFIAEEVSPIEAERRKLARLIETNKYDFVDLT